MTTPSPDLVHGVTLMTASALQRAESELVKAAREMAALGRLDLMGEIHELRRRVRRCRADLVAEARRLPHCVETCDG